MQGMTTRLRALKRLSHQLINHIQSKRSLGHLGAVLLAIPVGCLAIVLLAVVDSRRQEEQLQQSVRNTELRLKSSQLVLHYIIDQETGLRGYLLTQEPQFLEPYYNAKRDLPNALATLKQQSPDQAAQLNLLNQQIERRLKLSDEMLSLAKSLEGDRPLIILSKPNSALSQSQSDFLLSKLREGRQTTDALRQGFGEFEEQQRTLLNQQQVELQSKKRFVDLVQLLGAFLSITTYIGIVYLFHLLDRQVFQQDQELASTQSTTQAMTNNLIDGVLILNHRGIIESLNPAAERILGYPNQSLRGQSIVQVLFPIGHDHTSAEIQETVHQTDSEPISENVLVNLNGNNTDNTILNRIENNVRDSIGDVQNWLEMQLERGELQRLQAYRQDGSSLPIELSISRSSAQTPRLIVLVRDISERIRLTQALEEKVQELAIVNQTLRSTNLSLQRKNQSLENFVQAAAHDLKTPLRGIASLAQWIEADLDRALVNPDMQNYFKLLHQRVLRMQNITNELLRYTRIESWIEELQTVDVGNLITEICQSIPVPPTFNVQVLTRMPKIVTSYSALKLIFEELLINSIEHHDRNQGIIRIAAIVQSQTSQSQTSQPQTSQPQTSQQQSVEFIVRDDGPGIPSHYRERVLQMFQVLEQNTDVSDRIGAGLALVNKAIELNGGQLQLLSATGTLSPETTIDTDSNPTRNTDVNSDPASAQTDRGLEVRFIWRCEVLEDPKS